MWGGLHSMISFLFHGVGSNGIACSGTMEGKEVEEGPLLVLSSSLIFCPLSLSLLRCRRKVGGFQ